MLYLQCLCITLICVFVTDIFCFWETFSKGLMCFITKGKINAPIKGKLFYCSLCQNFWLSLIYLFCVGCVSIPNILYITALSFSTNILKETLLTLEDKIINLIRKI